jgi:DNA invertase Pin-like site-specific DNA recombinase
MQRRRKRGPKKAFLNPPAPSGPTIVGYARVSTADQNLDMQIADLRKYGIHEDDIYSEKVSASGKRPRLKAALARLRSGDKFVVWRLDRLGRSLLGILKQVEWFNENGIELVILHGAIKDISSASGKFMVAMLAAFSELERDLIRERTSAGLARKRERGEPVGRKREIDLDEIRRLLREGYTDREIEARTKFTRQAWYRYIAPPEREKLRDAGQKARLKRRR